jgi:hypothetical protein
MTGHECTAECWEQMKVYGTRLTESCTSSAARLAAEGVDQDAPAGGWEFSGEKGWLLDPSQEERVRRVNAEAMARIDEKQAHYPRCVVCGQRCIRLDQYGTCSKISKLSPPHREFREEADRMPDRGVSFR